jgi:hypothetical protein
MSKQTPSAEYGGLIPWRVAALGPASQPDSGPPGLERAVYRLIVRLGEIGTWSRAAASRRAAVLSHEGHASGIS